MKDPKQRQTGVYVKLKWESYPPNTPGIEDNILVIEKVAGDGTLTTFECSRGTESEAIRKFLNDDFNRGGSKVKCLIQ